MKFALSMFIAVAWPLAGLVTEANETRPIELTVLQSSVGIWDAHIEVWSSGLDSPPTTFDGVETNRPYGEHWIASDFDSDYMGQTMKVHSIIGYDLDQKRLVGTVIDHGPYSATMTGDYDKDTKTITWITKAKALNGDPMIQKTSVTQTSPDERVLVLSVPGEEKNSFVKFMQIKFVKRK